MIKLQFKLPQALRSRGTHNVLHNVNPEKIK